MKEFNHSCRSYENSVLSYATAVLWINHCNRKTNMALQHLQNMTSVESSVESSISARDVFQHCNKKCIIAWKTLQEKTIAAEKVVNNISNHNWKKQSPIITKCIRMHIAYHNIIPIFFRIISDDTNHIPSMVHAISRHI